MSVFITGTDTGCGKTHVSAGLLAAHAAQGRRVAGMKPVATGATLVGDRLVNSDVEALAHATNCGLSRDAINPYCFELPASPHLAAAAAGRVIERAPILAAYTQCRARADLVIVEGVGGWCVPLARDFWIADLVRMLELPVVMVVGIKLGCINHALLSVREMERSGSAPSAWIGNVLDPALCARDGVIATLREHIPAPLAGVMEWSPDLTGPAVAPAFMQLATALAGVHQTAAR